MARARPRYLRLGLRVGAIALIAVACGLWAFWARRVGSLELRVFPARLPPGDYEPRADPPKLDGTPEEIDRFRADALARAKVWRAPRVPIVQADLTRNVDETFDPTQDVSCQYLFEESHGFSPKFDCVLPGGEVIRVKYGRGNGEVFAETAATRLLAAMGFGADRESVVRTVRCFGCPPYPYPRWGEWWNRLLPAHGGYREFDVVVIERGPEGTSVPGRRGKGWAWHELGDVDPARGGASAIEKDALRLTAVFLAHWDNKPENQRLVCLDRPKALADGCRRPFALIQDAGSTFGPTRVDLGHWRAAPLWSDPSRCVVSMRSLPYDGGTFGDAPISEGGRRFVADRLGALSHAQVRSLFAGARFDLYSNASAEGRDLDRWTEAFESRVAQIREAGPCP
jgi:hypothetical protein